jgi:hypothetical protein
MIRSCIVAGIAASLAALPAFADGSSRGWGQGGRLAPFLQIVQQYNASGERFRIEGHCQSACTLFLSIRNVCVERGAELLFHAGEDRRTQTIGLHVAATQTMLAAYNARLRSHLLAGHHMDTGTFYRLPGSAIVDRFGYRPCPRGQGR